MSTPHGAESSGMRRVSFRDEAEILGHHNDAGAPLPPPNPLLALWGFTDPDDKLLQRFLRVSCSWLHTKPPGLTQFTREDGAGRWAPVLAAIRAGELTPADLDQLVVEIFPWSSPPGGAWSVEHVEELATFGDDNTGILGAGNSSGGGHASTTPSPRPALAPSEVSAEIQADAERRGAERLHRQRNAAGATTMISAVGRIMVDSLRKFNPGQVAEARRFVDKAIGNQRYPVLMFGKSTCPRCQQAEALLTSLAPPPGPHILYLDTLFPNNEDGTDGIATAVQDYLWDMTGCRTVPRIFIRGISIGGFDDVLELHEAGELTSRLQESKQQGPDVLEPPIPDIVEIRVRAIAGPSEATPKGDSTSAGVMLRTSMNGVMIKSAVMTALGLRGEPFSSHTLLLEFADGERQPLPSRADIPGALTHAQAILVHPRGTKEAGHASPTKE